jgi:hypothetical protein
LTTAIACARIVGRKVNMVEAELLEYINNKRYTLEEYRAGNPRVSKALLRVLEDELKDLELAFARADANLKKVLVDKCAGE